MNITEIIIVVVILGVIVGAVFKLVRDKKRGIRCTGCSACSNAECSSRR